MPAFYALKGRFADCLQMISLRHGGRLREGLDPHLPLGGDAMPTNSRIHIPGIVRSIILVFKVSRLVVELTPEVRIT
jgi:hypothetical protein